jgi:hypothetical protein
MNVNSMNTGHVACFYSRVHHFSLRTQALRTMPCQPWKQAAESSLSTRFLHAAVLSLVSMAFGARKLTFENSLVNFRVDSESIKWLAIVWALHEAMPGLIFVG